MPNAHQNDTQQFRREPLTIAEQDALIKACVDYEENLVIWSLLETGLRVSELASIAKTNIDFQSHRLTVYGKGHGGKKRIKGKEQARSKRRVIKISERLQPILEPHIAVHATFGIKIRTIQRIVTRVAVRASVLRATSPHVLRHCFAVNALKRGVKLRVLQEWLGHENIQTTARYLNLSPDDVIDDFERMYEGLHK